MTHLKTIALYAVGLLVLGWGLFYSGCQPSSPDESGVGLGDIVENPDQYYGATITVSGEVDRIYTPRIFTIGGGDFEHDLLVLSTDSIALVEGRTEDVPVFEQDIVQVTGEIQNLDPATLEENYDLELRDELEEEFAEQPVLVAQQSANQLHGIVVTPRVPGPEPNVVNDLTEAVEASEGADLQGRVAAFASVPIQEAVGPRMFWIGESEEERLFVVASPESTPEMEEPEPGQEWALHGVFRELPAPGELQAEWGIDDEVADQLEDHDVYLHALDAEPVAQ